MRRGGVLMVLWVVVAFAAIGVGTWALSLVGGRINESAAAPLSADQIDSRLNADRAGQDGAQPSDASPTDRAGRSGQHTEGITRGLSTVGGTASATCTTANLAHLNTWSPQPGYHVDGGEVLRGPAPTATIVFESDTKDDVVLTVHCVNGMPSKAVTAEADDHGGRRDGGSDDAATTTGGSTVTSGGSGGGSGGTSGGSGGSSGGSPAPTAAVTDDHGGHGADDPPGDDHGGG